MTTETWASVFLCLLSLVTDIYLLTYIAASPWWATMLGRIYALKTLLFALVLTQNAASVLNDSEYPARQVIRLVLYAGSTVAMIALWQMMRRYQREGKALRAALGDTRPQWRVWVDSLREWMHRQ